MSNEVTVVQPLLKWVGGKTQIIDTLIEQFPKEINNYYEPFLGGGSVLLALLSHKQSNSIKVTGKVYAFDINDTLIHFYINVQQRHTEVYNEIVLLSKAYSDIKTVNAERITDNSKKGKIVKPKTEIDAMSSKESYYYWMRDIYNEMSVESKRSPKGSALFLFINKTCFRGLFRENSDGHINTPFGNYKTPMFVNVTHLNTVHKLIKDVQFICMSFTDSLMSATINDFVYMDPPYAPESATSFVGYTTNGFNMEAHTTLFTNIHELHSKGVKFMMSNANVPFVIEKFNGYNVKIVECKRRINSTNPEATTQEVIISN